MFLRLNSHFRKISFQRLWNSEFRHSLYALRTLSTQKPVSNQTDPQNDNFTTYRGSSKVDMGSTRPQRTNDPVHSFDTSTKHDKNLGVSFWKTNGSTQSTGVRPRWLQRGDDTVVRSTASNRSSGDDEEVELNWKLSLAIFIAIIIIALVFGDHYTDAADTLRERNNQRTRLTMYTALHNMIRDGLLAELATDPSDPASRAAEIASVVSRCESLLVEALRSYGAAVDSEVLRHWRELLEMLQGLNDPETLGFAALSDESDDAAVEMREMAADLQRMLVETSQQPQACPCTRFPDVPATQLLAAYVVEVEAELVQQDTQLYSRLLEVVREVRRMQLGPGGVVHTPAEFTTESKGFEVESWRDRDSKAIIQEREIRIDGFRSGSDSRVPNGSVPVPQDQQQTAMATRAALLEEVEQALEERVKQSKQAEEMARDSLESISSPEQLLRTLAEAQS